MDQSRLNTPSKVLAAVAVIVLTLRCADAADIHDRMSLLEAIKSVTAQGFDVSYSSLLVKPWMRVRVTPAESDPLSALKQVLAEYGLALEENPANGWLIVKGEPPDHQRDVPVPDRVAAATTDAPRAPSIEEITIVASRYSIFGRDGTSGHFLSGDDIRLMPHIADDAFRVLHRLPGVAATDYRAPFNLRGGAIDEVKVVLDGLELFEPYHMRTLFSPLSIVDPGIIGQAQLLSGGYTVEHGNQMSGVVDIVSAWPDGEPVHQIGVSFVSSFARSSGAFADSRGAYQIAARRGYLDLITDAITDEGEELSPRYGDIFAGLRYRLNESVELAAHILSATDDVEFVDPDDGEDSGGESSLNYAWVTIDAEPADGLNLTNTVFAGRVDTTEDGALVNGPFENVDRFFQRDIRVSGLQSDLSWRLNDRALWKLGARYRNLSADYDYHLDSTRQTDITNNGQPFTLVRDIVTSRDGDEFGAYAAFRFQAFDRLTSELGLRWDKQTYTDAIDDTQVSPRINGMVSVNDRTEIRLGWGHYHQPQGIQDLQVQDGVTDFYPAQRAEHRVVGIRHRRESGLEMQLDVYEKKYRDVRPRFENAIDTYEFAPESNFDRIRVAPDSAESRGLEMTVRNRRSESLEWWLNYTWSEAEDVVDGISIPRSWDQRHAVTGNVTWQGDRWKLSAIARYHSGWPRTPLLLLPVFDGGGNFIGAGSDISQRNSQDYDDYSRLDLRLSRTVALDKSNFEYYFEIYNVFDAVNECCVNSHTLQFGPSVVASPDVDDFLPFFPSFGFVWTFGPGVDGDGR